MRQKEAQIEADKQNNEREEVYCPVKQGACVANCEWYDKARVHRPKSYEPDPARFHVLGGYCEFGWREGVKR
jgi:hypothetical protein